MLNKSEREQILQIVRKAQSDLRACYQIAADVETSQRNMWADLAGPEFENMLRDRELTQGYLRHPNAKLRLVALFMIRDHWKPMEGFASVCEEMAVNDADAEVRAVALCVLARIYAKTNDARIGLFLARIVRNEVLPSSIRFTAYNGLFQVSGRPVGTWPAMQRVLEQFRFPEDVDWSFVDSFLAKENQE